MDDHNTQKPYRLCVGIALFNKQGHVFVGRRYGGAEGDNKNYQWQLPQGGIDDNEDPPMAAARDLVEETNITSVRFLQEKDEWLSYDLPQDLAKKAWRGRYGGQKQKWFAYLFEGDESEIDVANPGDGHYKAEFKEWRWEPLENVPNLVIPFKRDVYLNVVSTFLHHAKTLRG
jgi:putative (di)nucleoside polyphosphate hydrolase